MKVREVLQVAGISRSTFARWVKGYSDTRGWHPPLVPSGVVRRLPTGRLHVDDATFWAWWRSLGTPLGQRPPPRSLEAHFKKAGL